MDILASLILGGLFNSAKGIYERQQEREEGKKQTEYQLSLLNADQKAADSEYSLSLLSNDQQFLAEKGQAQQKAQLTLDQARQSYLQSMKSTYLDSLDAESKYADSMASFTQQIGSNTASQGASGAKDTILTSVLKQEASRQLAEQQASIDRTTENAVAVGKMGLATASKEAQSITNQYAAGGIASQLYALRKSSLESQYTLDTQKRALQTSYLDDLSKSYDYNWDWFAADVFNIGSQALSVWGQSARTKGGLA